MLNDGHCLPDLGGGWGVGVGEYYLGKRIDKLNMKGWVPVQELE